MGLGWEPAAAVRGGFLGVTGAGSGWMGFLSQMCPPAYVLILSRSLRKTPLTELTEESEESEKDPMPEEPVQVPSCWGGLNPNPIPPPPNTSGGGCGAGGEGLPPCRALPAPTSLPLTAASSIPQAPVLEDIDKEQLGDPYANAQYAKDIFDYMREREVGDACLGGLCGVPGGLFFFFFLGCGGCQ